MVPHGLVVGTAHRVTWSFQEAGGHNEWQSKLICSTFLCAMLDVLSKMSEVFILIFGIPF